MAMYYIKDVANPVNPVWSEFWINIKKQKLKPERDRLNLAHSSEGCKYKRFVIGTMK